MQNCRKVVYKTKRRNKEKPKFDLKILAKYYVQYRDNWDQADYYFQEKEF